MKKLNFYITLAFSIFLLQSCEKETIEETNTTEVLNYQTQSTTGIHAMKIDNGVSTTCANNILVFPNWETFRQTAQQLDDEWENGIDNINTRMPADMSDEEIRDYFAAQGFNEDQPYINFEEQYQFCSLRASLAQKEEAWLSRRTSEEDWNEVILTDPDPDSHFIWDEERPLLNAQSEVIVKDSIGNNIIYKFYPGGHVAISNNNTDALSQLNLEGPFSHTDLTWTHPVFVSPETIGQTPIYFAPGAPGGDPNKCKYENREEKYFYPESDKRIKAVDLFRYYENNIFSPIRAKAKTKHYNKNIFGGWTKGPSQISAGLHSNYRLNCVNAGQPYPLDIKTEYSSKVKTIWDYRREIDERPEIIRDNLFGTHKRRGWFVKVMDHHDGQVQ